MKINNYIIRPLDGSNIVTHKDYGFDKTGAYVMNDTATYHGSIEEALRSVRRRLRAEGIKAEMSFDELFDKLKKIDEKFIEEIKKSGVDLSSFIPVRSHE